MKMLSARLALNEPSATLAVADRARRLQREGVDVISLATGDPDFATPEHIVQAAEAALRSGDTHYPPVRGRPELIDAIVDKLGRENGVRIGREQVVITPGAKWALFIAIAALVNKGDEVVVLDPSWVSYAPIVTLNDAVPVHVGLDHADNYRITEDRLRRAVTSRTKAIIVNNPCNPTGRVLTQEEIDAIAAIATSEDLYVVSDEIYEKIVFGVAHKSVAAHPGMAERTLIVNGFSKAYAMTGWRLGWLAAPEPVASLALALHSQAITSASSFVMAGGVAALTGPQDCVAEMVDSYAERSHFMVDALNSISGIECRMPEGAFYLFPRFSAPSLTNVAIAEQLLLRAAVATVPGAAFGEGGEGHVRLTVATSRSDLERAVERLAAVVPSL
jgi:Aspartate/tyrosine/aromatic aminotransferase